MKKYANTCCVFGTRPNARNACSATDIAQLCPFRTETPNKCSY